MEFNGKYQAIFKDTRLPLLPLLPKVIIFITTSNFLAKETWTLEKEQEFSAQLALRVQRAGSPTYPSSPPALTESTLTRRLEEAHHAWSSTELPRALEEAKQTWRETELRAAVEEAKEEARAAAAQSTTQLDTSQDLKTAVSFYVRKGGGANFIHFLYQVIGKRSVKKESFFF